MIQNSPIRVSRPLSKSSDAHPLDVLKIKSTLGVLGHYDAPDWGVSQFPDADLFTAVEKFQRAQRLKVDGVVKPGGPTEDALQSTLTENQTGTALHITARALQDMGRGGDEILAHINPAEAQLMHDITDGGSINPQTGLLEFRIGRNRDASNTTHSYSSFSEWASSVFGGKKDKPKVDKVKADKSTQNSFAGNRSDRSGQDQQVADNMFPSNKPIADVIGPENKSILARRRSRTVTTPDDDPSLSGHFLDKKNEEEVDNSEGRMLRKITRPKYQTIPAGIGGIRG